MPDEIKFITLPEDLVTEWTRLLSEAYPDAELMAKPDDLFELNLPEFQVRVIDDGFIDNPDVDLYEGHVWGRQVFELDVVTYNQRRYFTLVHEFLYECQNCERETYGVHNQAEFETAARHMLRGLHLRPTADMIERTWPKYWPDDLRARFVEAAREYDRTHPRIL